MNLKFSVTSSQSPLNVLEKMFRSPLDRKEIKPVNPKRNQPWIFSGRTDAEAEAPVHWPPDVKSCLTGKDLDAGKDWSQEEKEITENETVGWHHWLNGHEFEQALGDGEGQGSLGCYSPWDRKQLDTTEWLNNNLWMRFYCLCFSVCSDLHVSNFRGCHWRSSPSGSSPWEVIPHWRSSHIQCLVHRAALSASVPFCFFLTIITPLPNFHLPWLKVHPKLGSTHSPGWMTT